VGVHSIFVFDRRREQCVVPHAVTVGFISLMILGTAGNIVPTVNGVDIRKLRTLPLLLAKGFKALANPITRKTLARAISVRQAGTHCNLEVNDLLAELNQTAFGLPDGPTVELEGVGDRSREVDVPLPAVLPLDDLNLRRMPHGKASLRISS
jgi:hypothetical protein